MVYRSDSRNGNGELIAMNLKKSLYETTIRLTDYKRMLIRLDIPLSDHVSFSTLSGCFPSPFPIHGVDHAAHGNLGQILIMLDKKANDVIWIETQL